MGGSTPTPPAVPNPTDVASTAQKYNVGTASSQAALNNVSQNTPFGSLTYNQTGTGPNGVPTYTATTSLSPAVQSILDSLQGGVKNQLTQGGYGTNNPTDVIGNATAGNTKALLGQEVSYLQPFYDTQTSQLDTQLRNQGLDPNNPAYTNQMRNLRNNQNQSVQNFLATAEPQAYSQSVNNYTLPLTTAQTEMGIINPNYATQSLTNTPQTSVAPVDYTGAVNNAQNALNTQYAQQVKANSNMMSGLFGIPTAILGGWAQSGGLSKIL